MAILRNSRQAPRPNAHDEPLASLETAPAADDSDNDDDSDDEDIPRKAARPSSSRTNKALVSLGRPTAKHPEPAGRTTRSGRTSLPLPTHEPAEQPSKRRKTVHGRDAYAIQSSPPPGQDSSKAQAQDNVDIKDGIMAGLLRKVHKTLGAVRSTSLLADGLGETIRGTAPEKDTVVESDAAADGQQAEQADEHVDEKVEDAHESLFVPQEVLQSSENGAEEGLEQNGEGTGNAGDDTNDMHYKGSSTNGGEVQATVAPEQHVDGTHEGAEDDATQVDSDIIEGVDSDELEDYDDRQPPSTRRFRQDLADFNESHQADEAFAVSFTAPPEDSSEDVHVKFEQFRMAVLRMKEETWTGYMGANWVNQPMHTYFDPVTIPGKALFSLVRKVESLCAACPEAPRLRSQTRFLKSHESIISHYLSQLVSILHHICYINLVAPKASSEGEPTVAREKREIILNEAFRVHIPLLLQCSHVIWRLAGREDKNCFTAGTLDLLEFFLQAARQECESIIKLLRQSKEERKSSSRLSPLRTERVKQGRSAVQQIVYAINNIKAAREALTEEGEKRAIRQQKQAKLREQLERDQLATQAQLNEIESRRASMPSTQATNIASSQTRGPPASAPLKPMSKRPREQPSNAIKRPAQREKPPTPIQLAQRSREPIKLPPRQPPELHYRAWNLEEQHFLLREIKQAYIAIPDKPRLPDIDGYIRKELNRPIDDILHQTEALLALMLTKTGVVKDEVELEGWVRRLMATYDGVGRISFKGQNGVREEDVFGRE